VEAELIRYDLPSLQFTKLLKAKTCQMIAFVWIARTRSAISMKIQIKHHDSLPEATPEGLRLLPNPRLKG